MTDWVQYHNPASNPPLRHKPGYFAIYTRKPVGSVEIGDRVWVITSSGDRPKRYYLIEWFHVGDIEVNLPADDNRVIGTHGKFFQRPVSIDQERWFADFLRVLGNFGRGFSSIADKKFVAGLEKIAGISGSAPPARGHPVGR